MQKDVAVALEVSATLIGKMVKRGMPLSSIADAAEWKSKNYPFTDYLKLGETGSPDPAPALPPTDPTPTQAPLSQNDFAAALKVSKATISRFIHRKGNRMPVSSIADALEWHSKYLTMTLDESVSEVGESGSLHQPPTPVAAAYPSPPLVGPIVPARSSLQDVKEHLELMEEKIDLLRLVHIFAQLQSVQPGAALNSYFAARREMGFGGRRVVHISRTCPDLYQVRVFRRAKIIVVTSLQEGKQSQIYQAMAHVIRENMDVPLVGMRSPPPSPPSLPPLHTMCSAACSKACIQGLYTLYSRQRTFRYRPHTHVLDSVSNQWDTGRSSKATCRPAHGPTPLKLSFLTGGRGRLRLSIQSQAARSLSS